MARYRAYPTGWDEDGNGVHNALQVQWLDAEGKVLSYELVGRSGNADLDRATLEMIRRAGTVPKPPPELLNNGTIEVVAPFVYSLDRR